MSRTLEERLTKAKKTVRDTRWWVVVFKYCIEAVLLSFMHILFDMIEYLIGYFAIPRSEEYFIKCITYLLCILLLNVLIRWMF